MWEALQLLPTAWLLPQSTLWNPRQSHSTRRGAGRSLQTLSTSGHSHSCCPRWTSTAGTSQTSPWIEVMSRELLQLQQMAGRPQEVINLCMQLLLSVVGSSVESGIHTACGQFTESKYLHAKHHIVLGILCRECMICVLGFTCEERIQELGPVFGSPPLMFMLCGPLESSEEGFHFIIEHHL